MGLRKLYRIPKFPWITCVLVILCIITSIAGGLSPTLYHSLAFYDYGNKAWQYITFLFVHGNEAGENVWIHLGMNLIGLIPFAMLIEKLLGSTRTVLLFLVEWELTLGLFWIFPKQEKISIAGISTIVYAYAVITLVCLIKVIRIQGKRVFCSPLTYFFFIECFGMLSMMNPMMMSRLSLYLHGSGILIGTAASAIWNQRLNEVIHTYIKN